MKGKKILLKSFALDRLQKYNSFVKIYTDGSKIANKTSSAFVSPTFSKKQRIRNGSSIFTAEIIAIYEALKFCDTQNEQKFLICSDSLSAIQALDKMFSKISLVLRAQDLLHSSKKEIQFLWIPGHVGIKGNEEADRLAKIALDSNTILKNKILWADFKNISGKKLREKWQNHWNLIGTQNKFYRIKNNIDKWKSIDFIHRKSACIITRLRTGHTRATHGYLMEMESQQPICVCGSTLTVDHIFSCPQKLNKRSKWEINGIEDLGKDDIETMKKIIGYVKDIGYYHEI